MSPEEEEEGDCISSTSGFVCHPCSRSFGSWPALTSHLLHSSRHHYCIGCRREFGSHNALRSHLRSKLHHAADILCPRCNSGFVSASALAKHIEVGNCFNVTNSDIDEAAQRWEDDFGQPNLLRIPWNSRDCDEDVMERTTSKDYVCEICYKGFNTSKSLTQHLNSNIHEAPQFWCQTCNERQFRDLSALLEHWESEVCGMEIDTTSEIIKGIADIL